MSTTPPTPPPSSTSEGPAPPQPACSACKHQRRRCSPGCPLAPYFPADHPALFRNAHRLFGIKNILRIMERAGPEKRDDAMKAMMYEADARASDPVHGAMGVRHALGLELHRAQAELAAVRQQLAIWRHHAAADPDAFPSPPPLPTSTMIVPAEAQRDGLAYSSYAPAAPYVSC